MLELLSKAKKAIKPSDASAVIKVDAELDQLQLKGVKEFSQQGGRSDGIVIETDHELFLRAYDVVREE